MGHIFSRFQILTCCHASWLLTTRSLLLAEPICYKSTTNTIVNLLTSISTPTHGSQLDLNLWSLDHNSKITILPRYQWHHCGSQSHFLRKLFSSFYIQYLVKDKIFKDLKTQKKVLQLTSNSNMAFFILSTSNMSLMKSWTAFGSFEDELFTSNFFTSSSSYDKKCRTQHRHFH